MKHLKGRPLAGAIFAVYFAMGLTVLGAEPASPQDDVPLSPGASVIFSQEMPPPVPPEVHAPAYLRTSIIPMSGIDSPIRIRFESSVDLASLDPKGSDLHLTVSQNGRPISGTLQWENPRELRFIPPHGAIAIGDEIGVRLSGHLPLTGSARLPVDAETSFQVEEFRMGNKVSPEPVIAGKPRFVAFLDSNIRKIGSGPLCLLFDQAIDPSTAAPMITAFCGGEALDVQVRRPEALSFDSEGLYALANVVAVSFPKLPPDGAIITLPYPTTVEGDTSVLATMAFEVFTDFRWASTDFESLKSGSAARLESRWSLRLSSPIDPEAFIASFSISPPPPSLDFEFGYDNEVDIHAKFDVGKLYSIKMAPAFVDLLGNRLREPLNFAFKSQDLTPVLELPAYTLLLESGSNRLPVKYRNIKSIKVQTYRFPDTPSFIEALAQGETGDTASLALIDEIPVQPADTTLNALFRSEFGIGANPGLKLVQILANGRGSESQGAISGRALIQTSDLGLSAKVSDGAVFAWVTRLSSAEPVEGANIDLYDASGIRLGTATTDRDGIATIHDLHARGSELDEPLFLAASSGDDTSVCRLVNQELSGAWQFDLPGSVKGPKPLAAAIFTERGAYRPGETVHLKAYVRNLPEYYGASSLSCSIRDPRGQEVFSKTALLDEYRGSAWDFTTETGAAVGDYTATVTMGDYFCTRSFHVEEYRVPTFQVVVSDSGASWANESETTVNAVASYFKGGVLAGRPLSWRVYRQPTDYAPPGFPGYVFTLERDIASAGTVEESTTTLDSQGGASLTFTPSHQDEWGPMNYIVQASVTDSDQQNYAGRLTRLVHATDVYVGLRPPSHAVFHEGETITFPVIVTDIGGTALAGRKVSVILDTLHYEQNTMVDGGGSSSTYNREVVSSQEIGSLASGNGPIDFSFEVPKAGIYRIRLQTIDQRGHVASTAFGFTASGGESVAWPRFDRERIDLVLDRSSYQAGDTATVIAQTPFKDARGLLTIEANGVIDRYPFEIKGNTPSISFPVKGEYAPNAYVSVILVRGRSHWAKDATGFETGAPAYRVGYARIAVDPAAQRLAVSIFPEKITASPGQQVNFGFQVADAKGRPSDASATVMVVDEAVLGLTAFATPDPVALAYSFRALAVRNASNILDLPYSRRSRFEKMFPGGDSDLSQNLPVSDDLLRKLFKSTAFYAPTVPVGADGKGTVSFKLPDNLTTYRVMVVVANRNGQMGSSQTPLLTRKSFAVEPVLPRFVYEGDELVIQARVFNSTGIDSNATVVPTFSGISPLDGGGPASVKVVTGDSTMVSYRVKVSEGAKLAKVRYDATMGNLRDAVEYSIPVRLKGNSQTSTGNAIIVGSGAVELALPALHTPGTVEVVLSQTPLSELKDSVQYLMRYPNGCIEQTTSTAYPLIVLKDLLPAIGVDVNMADLKAYSEAGVARILSFQVDKGGLSYWPGGKEPHAFATAFGLQALIEAKKRGYNVPDAALKGMGDFLEESLAKGKITGEMPHAAIADADTRAIFVMTLGRLGRPQPSYIKALWEKKDQLTPFGLAFLAIAVRESKGNEALLDPILAEMRNDSIRAKREAYYDSAAKGGWSFDSPLRTDAGALNAFAIVGSDPEMAQDLLRGLLARRRGGLWGNTQENVFGIMGIYQLVAASQGATASGPAPTGLIVTINGKRFDPSSFEHNSLGVLRLTIPESSLGSDVQKVRIEVAGPPSGSVYATLRASYEVPVDAAFLSPRSEGFAYKRSYESLDGTNLDGKDIPLGSLVRVKLLVKNQTSRHYVAIDDLLPAGLEPLNEHLATTEAVTTSPLTVEAVKAQGVTSYSEMRDYRVAFYADELPAGDYEFSYVARATTPGVFFLPQGRVEAMYAPAEYGTTDGGFVTVR
jgi:hypothetical protein